MSTLHTLYYSFIFPYLNYCIQVWGSASKIHLDSICKLQKRAIRIIASAKYCAHTGPIFNKLNILPFKKVYQYNIILFMYKFVRGMLPDVFNSMFIINTNVCQYNTRQSNKLYIPKCKLSKMQTYVTHKGILLWNYIVDIIDRNCSGVSYKKHVKHYLIHNEINI